MAIERVARVVTMDTADDTRQHWLTVPRGARVAAIEAIRAETHGWTDDTWPPTSPSLSHCASDMKPVFISPTAGATGFGSTSERFTANVIGLDDLVANKRAFRRLRDLADIEDLGQG